MTDFKPDGSPQCHAVWNLVALIVSLSALAWLGVTRSQGPTPLAPDAASQSAPGQFSAIRAMKLVDLISGDGTPHPAGSAANDEVRERIIDWIEQLQLEVEVQSTSHFRYRDPARGEVPLENLIVRLPANQPAAEPMTLMLAAHYDSSVNGPGAADDAAGVAAVLEALRLLNRTPARQHHVICLLTDGEEMGLLGADRFLAEHPAAAEIDLCINVEARGNRGPSLMFQTGDKNLDLIRLLAGHLERPATGSLFDAVYRRMPNDTDFTLFQRAGIRGYNFACIGNVLHYHTPDDTVANLDLRSLQHHGDNTWQLARAIVTSPGRLDGEGSAVWFDFFGWWVIWWPTTWSLPLALACFAPVLVPARGRLPGRSGSRFVLDVLLSVLALACLVVVAGLAAAAMHQLLRLDRGLDHPWPGNWKAVWVLVSQASATLCVFAGGTWLLHGRLAIEERQSKPERSLLFATLLVWFSFAVLLAIFLPGASYLFLAPGLVAASGLLVEKLWPAMTGLAIWMLVLGAGVIWWPLVPSLYEALGFRPAGPLPSIWPPIVAIFGSCLVPAIAAHSGKQLARWFEIWVFALVIALVAAVLIPGIVG